MLGVLGILPSLASHFLGVSSAFSQYFGGLNTLILAIFFTDFYARVVHLFGGPLTMEYVILGRKVSDNPIEGPIVTMVFEEEEGTDPAE